MAMRFGVDPWPRIEFYVRNGLVERMPTVEQLEKAGKLNVYHGGGTTERVKYYVRHPLDLFPTQAKKRDLHITNRELMVGAEEHGAGELQATGDNQSRPLFDRILYSTFLFSPARYAAACYFNPYGWVVPWNAIPGTGLTVPLPCLISHLVHAPHPSALWDMQIIHPDAGGLDQLEREIDLASTSRRLKYRVYRAMAQRPGYYDYLRELIPRVRRFDYPPPPRGRNPNFENLVDFLNLAITL
jgi:hypothetical protein